MKQLILISLIILLISLVACGKPEEEPVNPEAVIDCQETITAHQNLLLHHSNLEAECQHLKERDVEYATAINTLSAENLALRTALALNQSLGESRQIELASALNELIKLREEKKEWGRLAEREYEQLLESYNKLSTLFPPSHFASKDKLVEWRASSGNMSEGGCLELQRRALSWGYIVSVHPDLEYCVVIAGDYWYRIIPSDQDLVEKIRRVN